MISRNRSAPTVAAMSIEVHRAHHVGEQHMTCLYSAGLADTAFGRNSDAQLMQVNAAVIGRTIGPKD